MGDTDRMRHIWVGMVTLGWSAAAQAGFKDKLPLEAYIDPIDQQIARTGVGQPGRPSPCAYEETQMGIKVVVGRPTELCVKMMPSQHWRGLWRNDFEGSRFCPEPATACDYQTPGERIWLSRTPGRPEGGLYWLEFVGRRTMYKGPYGHMGGSDQELLIDRVISMKELEAPPPPPTKAEIIKQMKACEAAKTCIPNWEEINKIEE